MYGCLLNKILIYWWKYRINWQILKNSGGAKCISGPTSLKSGGAMAPRAISIAHSMNALLLSASLDRAHYLLRALRTMSRARARAFHSCSGLKKDELSIETIKVLETIKPSMFSIHFGGESEEQWNWIHMNISRLLIGVSLLRYDNVAQFLTLGFFY